MNSGDAEEILIGTLRGGVAGLMVFLLGLSILPLILPGLVFYGLVLFPGSVLSSLLLTLAACLTLGGVVGGGIAILAILIADDSLPPVASHAESKRYPDQTDGTDSSRPPPWPSQHCASRLRASLRGPALESSEKAIHGASRLRKVVGR